MILKPQDVLVALHAALRLENVRFSYSEVGARLGMSKSEVHASVKRCVQAGLMMQSHARVDRAPAANRANLLEFLIHGVRFAFPATEGTVSRGMPTAHAAPSLAPHFAGSKALPPVWPLPTGQVRGRAFEPLYRSVPIAAANDPAMYEALALVDSIRSGGAREREIATRLLGQVLQ